MTTDQAMSRALRGRVASPIASAGALVLLLFSAASSAQQPPLAQRLFQEGKEKADEGREEEACALFKASADLDPRPSVRFKVAGCLETKGHLIAALGEYRALREIEGSQGGPQSADRQAEAEARLHAVESRIASVRLALPRAAWVTATLDGLPIPESDIQGGFPVDPGAHRLEVNLPGGAKVSRSFNAAEGEKLTVDLTKAVVISAPAAPSSSTTPPVISPALAAEARPNSPGLSWIAGVGLTGLGAASLGAALAFSIDTNTLIGRSNELMALRAEEGTNALRDQARTSQVAGFVALGAGVALMGTGIVVLAVRVNQDKGPASTVQAAVHPFGAGLRARW